VLGTPTGSGKSLAAWALHFKALCEGRHSFYTSPVKALVSEKFFAMCDDFGAANVGMMTGDATINREAPIICCTAEVLANMALREGEALDAPYAVMDEFHYYADRERGMAWQIPLLVLTKTTFLLMSATLGDMSSIADELEQVSGRPVSTIVSELRPVPLDFDYAETPIHETVEGLLEQKRSPIYIVHFTQRECHEQAQALCSAKIATRAERERIAGAIDRFRFDSPYGRELARFLRAGIGVHHAGLLPKYRLLVEQLSQRGLLKVICGTDTLGVGVNIPIRTVLFTQLCKFDGQKVALLRAREFKQIAGRAGRKGFDERGSVVAQAPAWVIEARRRRQKGGKKPSRAPGPPRGRALVPWSRDTFQRLIHQPPERLESHFEVTHGMVLSVLQRPAERGGPTSGYRALVELIARSHEDARSKRRLRRDAAVVFRSLRRAGIVEVVADPSGGATVRISGELQPDFSLHRTLSLYLVEVIDAIDPDAEGYALDLLSLVEAILEDPMPILYAQENEAKGELIAKLKAQGVDYEERLRELEKVSYPRPNAEFIYGTFDAFAEHHPWVRHEDVHPKSIAREMFEGGYGFERYVRRYGIQRVEGLLLRYLSQTHNVLVQNVPATARTESFYDVIAYLRALIERVDTSLIDTWESLLAGEVPGAEAAAAPVPGAPPRPPALSLDHPAFRARVRAEMHRLVRALAARDYEEAEHCVREDPLDAWPPARFEQALAPFYAEHEKIVWSQEARLADKTLIRSAGEGLCEITQILLDPAGDHLWCLQAEVDLRAGLPGEGPLVRLRRIGT
jgi:superfamily II RNA helicase